MSNEVGNFVAGILVAAILFGAIGGLVQCSRGDPTTTVECIDKVLYEKKTYKDMCMEYAPMRSEGRIVHCPVGEIVEKP